MGGPEKFRLDELIRLGLASDKDSREVVTDPKARYYGIAVTERTLVPEDDAKLGKIRFKDWLARRAAQAQSAPPQPSAVGVGTSEKESQRKAG